MATSPKTSMIVPNAKEHSGIENAVILVKSEIDEGSQRIVDTLARWGMSADDVYYEPVWFDNGDSQGGWGCSLNDLTRDKLRVCHDHSIRNVGMISGDDIESMLDAIRDTGNRMSQRALASTSSTVKHKTVRVTFTLAEYDKVLAKAGGQPITDYIRGKLL